MISYKLKVRIMRVRVHAGIAGWEQVFVYWEVSDSYVQLIKIVRKQSGDI